MTAEEFFRKEFLERNSQQRETILSMPFKFAEAYHDYHEQERAYKEERSNLANYRRWYAALNEETIEKLGFGKDGPPAKGESKYDHPFKYIPK